jgi:4-hydroxybenzoyl-CoA thioesterase
MTVSGWLDSRHCHSQPGKLSNLTSSFQELAMNETAADPKFRINRRTVQIQWGDCDPAGIVYFPRYFEIFDNCTEAAFEAVGWLKPRLIQEFGIVGFPAVDIKGRFVEPSSFGDSVVVETCVYGFGRSSFRVHHRLLRDRTLAVEGHEVRVWSAKDPQRPGRLHGVPVPQQIIDLLRASS